MTAGAAQKNQAALERHGRSVPNGAELFDAAGAAIPNAANRQGPQKGAWCIAFAAGESIMLNMPAASGETPAMPISDRVLSLNEAAAISGLSPSSLKREATAERLHILRLSPRRRGIKLSEFNRWLSSR
jgi:hypothetical protein